jgi:hypothetical protein
MYLVVTVLLSGTVRDITGVFAAAGATALPVLLGLLGFNHVLRGAMPEALHLALGIALGVALWLGAFAVLDRPLLREARSLFRGKAA